MEKDNVVEFPSPPEWKKSYLQYLEEEADRQKQIEQAVIQLQAEVAKRNMILTHLYNTYEITRQDIENMLK